MFCTRCGKELKENEKFCSKCGAAVAGKNPDAKVQQTEKPQQAQVPKRTGKGITIKKVIVCMGAVIVAGVLLTVAGMKYLNKSQDIQIKSVKTYDWDAEAEEWERSNYLKYDKNGMYMYDKWGEYGEKYKEEYDENGNMSVSEYYKDTEEWIPYYKMKGEENQGVIARIVSEWDAEREEWVLIQKEEYAEKERERRYYSYDTEEEEWISSGLAKYDEQGRCVGTYSYDTKEEGWIPETKYLYDESGNVVISEYDKEQGRWIAYEKSESDEDGSIVWSEDYGEQKKWVPCMKVECNGRREMVISVYDEDTGKWEKGKTTEYDAENNTITYYFTHGTYSRKMEIALYNKLPKQKSVYDVLMKIMLDDWRQDWYYWLY